MREQVVKNQIQRLPSFMHLAIRQHNQLDRFVAPLQGRVQASGIQRSHSRVADNDRSACFGQVSKNLRIIEQRRAYMDGVTAVCQIYANRLHVL